MPQACKREYTVTEWTAFHIASSFCLLAAHDLHLCLQR